MIKIAQKNYRAVTNNQTNEGGARGAKMARRSLDKMASVWLKKQRIKIRRLIIINMKNKAHRLFSVVNWCLFSSFLMPILTTTILLLWSMALLMVGDGWRSELTCSNSGRWIEDSKQSLWNVCAWINGAANCSSVKSRIMGSRINKIINECYAINAHNANDKNISGEINVVMKW